MRTLLLMAVLAMTLLGCNGSPNNAAPGSRLATSAKSLSPTEDGRQIFVVNCAPCHGKNADGNTPAGRTWHVPDLHSRQVQLTGDQQLLEIIRSGKGKMPAWGGLLSQSDIAHVLAYVRTMGNP